MTAMEADDVETYRRHAAELIRYATALVGPDEAADVVTDAVLAAFRSPRWRDVANRRAYLYRAVLTRSASAHRSAARRRSRELRATPLATTTDPPSPTAIDAHRALAQLSEQQRAVVFLTYWEDLAPQTIAALLGVSDGTVRKQLARAREQLRRILDA
jgi:RNA polymerase sigma-70 factor (ECF subfamily)